MADLKACETKACWIRRWAGQEPSVRGWQQARGLLATGLFLYLNGYRLNASQADATITVFGLADGNISESELADWLRVHAAAR